MMHLPLFYKRFHKMHHEWTAPVGWAYIYNHPIDHLVSDVLGYILFLQQVSASQCNSLVCVLVVKC